MKQQELPQKAAFIKSLLSTDEESHPTEEVIIQMDRARRERFLYEAQEQDAFQQEVKELIDILTERREIDGRLVEFLTNFRGRFR